MSFLRSRSLLRGVTLGALALGFGASAGVVLPACAPAPTTHVQRSELDDLRRRAGRSGTEDGELLGRWAMAEMFDPGGVASEAKRARDRLGNGERPGLYANLARGIFDEAHGEPASAARFYVATLKAAQTSREPETALVAWYAARSTTALRGAVTSLFAQHRAALESVLAKPGPNVGWRAIAELEDFRASEVYDRAEKPSTAFDAEVIERMGCATPVRIAGPFGRGTGPDRRREFGPEKPGPWPYAFPQERGQAAHVLKSEQTRCVAAATERHGDGVFYAETYFVTSEPRDLTIAVQGAVKVWIDDLPVLERDLREWGVWQRFGSAVRVGAGRHRIVARLLSDTTSIRIMNPDGTAAHVRTDADASSGYAATPPTILPTVNALEPYVKAASAPTTLEAVLAAAAAHNDGLDDVAAVLLEPLVTPKDAAALALEMASMAARNDAAIPEDSRRRNERELRQRAVSRDGGLLYSRAWLVLDDAEQRGWGEAVAPLRRLAKEFPRTPEVLEQLANVFARLAWRAERMAVLKETAERFPDNARSLRLYLEALAEDGPAAEADRVAARIQKLEPDAEVNLELLLARRDYRGAVEELRRVEKRRPERKEIAARIAEVLERSGNAQAAMAWLAQTLAKNPEDASARFRLADRAFARGDAAALRRSLAESISVGARSVELRDAVDLIEGATNLEPYRLDGRTIIREFEEWEKKGHRMEGTAARVLDYAATWVHDDGSSEMLEHEILRIQSQEAVSKEAEQQPPAGLVLRLRVLKSDGRVLEPEFVAGKPTLTMPHLEVGDYIEIEHITPLAGDGEKGRRFRGPHWFFREADRGYFRSELLTLTPKDKKLDIETIGSVPPPKVVTRGNLVEHRFRMDLSPPAPDEPDAPRPTEFLPSVRLGWGISLPDMLDRAVDAVSDETPLDPRLRRRALEIVKGVPAEKSDERAERIYKWVVSSLQESRETDGRRAVLGKSGSLEAAFTQLVRQLAIPVEPAVVKNKLAPPPRGPMSEVEEWDSVVLRLRTNRGARWLTVRDKFAPYAYLPAELRGQPAIVLVPGLPRETTATQGSADGLEVEGKATLREDGSATVDFVQRYVGKMGISIRGVFDRLPEAQVRDFVEARIVGRTFPGARVRQLDIENKDSVDKPFTLRVRAEVPQLARVQGGQAILKPFFPFRLGQLATLPERQTPLMLGSSSHVEVKFDVELGDGFRPPAKLTQGEVRDGERVVLVRDAVAGRTLQLRRLVDVPAARVQPGKEYAGFARFTQEGDTLVEREIVLGR